jgi:hypothetical protein
MHLLQNLQQRLVRAETSKYERSSSSQLKEQELVRSNEQLKRQIKQAVANEKAAHEARINTERAMKALEQQTNQSLTNMQVRSCTHHCFSSNECFVCLAAAGDHRSK